MVKENNYNQFEIKNNTLIKYLGNAEKVKIPDEIKYIEREAFYNNKNLKEIDLNNVEIIRSNAFSGCKNLKEINGNKTQEIGYKSFCGCISLKKIDLSNVRIIDEAAFLNCVDLEYITNLREIEKIGEKSFKNCCNIKKIELSNKITEIKAEAFAECKSLKEINLEDITKIKHKGFYKCTNLEKIKLDKTIYIESYAFANTGLKELKIKNINEINAYAFDNLSLKQVEIEYNCKTIPGIRNIFNNSSIKKIIIKNNYKFMVDQYGILRNLEEIEIDNPLYKIKDGMIYNKAETSLIYCPPSINITEYKIPDTVYTIENKCFAYNEAIKLLILGNDVTYIEQYAFECAKIDKIIFNKNIEDIGNNIFLDAEIGQIDLSQSNIEVLNCEEANIYLEDVFEEEIKLSADIVILPNTLKLIEIENETDKVTEIFKIAQPKEKFNKRIQNFIEKNNIQAYYKTLEELIEEGKTFREASQMIKEYER